MKAERRNDYQTLLTAFCFERFLYRLGVSSARTRFVLKGAMVAARPVSPCKIDMGLGDSVWPVPQPCAYPALLDFPALTVLAYPPEAVVAEKLEAIVVLGDRNSRIKDFFDLHHLSALRPFLLPIIEDLRLAVATPGRWAPGGPWQSRTGPTQ